MNVTITRATVAFHADESFRIAATGNYVLARIEANEPGYRVAGVFSTLPEAKAAADARNAEAGLAADDVLAIRLSSMVASR